MGTDSHIVSSHYPKVSLPKLGKLIIRKAGVLTAYSEEFQRKRWWFEKKFSTDLLLCTHQYLTNICRHEELNNLAHPDKGMFNWTGSIFF